MKTDLIAGVDHLSLDQRTFDLSVEDIEKICRFFSIGTLRHFEKEKGVAVSHSNFFVFVKTAQGAYALKFYPPDAIKALGVEYALNRMLTSRNFPTPLMHAGLKGQAFIPSNGRLVTCFSYIDGVAAWQASGQRDTFANINAAMFDLKNILSKTGKQLPFRKQEGLPSSLRRLSSDSRSLGAYDRKETIEASLMDAARSYKEHRELFTRQVLHSNAGLTNFLIRRKTLYTLDLSHIREDYALSDLSSLVISCLFFDIPLITVKSVVKDYFVRHKIKKDRLSFLGTLIKTGLIREYLKNIKRERSAELLAAPPHTTRAFKSQLSKRKKAIIRSLICGGLI